MGHTCSCLDEVLTSRLAAVWRSRRLLGARAQLASSTLGKTVYTGILCHLYCGIVPHIGQYNVPRPIQYRQKYVLVCTIGSLALSLVRFGHGMFCAPWRFPRCRLRTRALVVFGSVRRLAVRGFLASRARAVVLRAVPRGFWTALRSPAAPVFLSLLYAV